MSSLLNYTIEFEPVGFVKVTAKGGATAYELIKMYHAAINFCDGYDTNRILVDVTEMEAAYPLYQLLPLMDRLSEILFNYRVARVTNQIDAFQQEIIEAASSKSAVDMKNFDNSLAAQAWLLAI